MADDVLFVLSGAGRDPVVVEENAQARRAAVSVIRLCSHDQGRDRAAPNVVFFSEAIVDVPTRELIERADDVAGKIALGRHPCSTVGANTDGGDVRSIHR